MIEADRDDDELDLRERSDSLVGRIANEIAREITEGRFRPGADLNSVELAVRFGTSRTPVREALMLLEKEGLVDIPPRRRPRVASFSLKEVEELYEIRAALNEMMMRLFTRSAPDDALETVRSHYEDIRAAALRSSDDFQAARRRLYNFCLENCGNASLISLLGRWKMRMSVGRLVTIRDDDVRRSLRDHERLVVAISERDDTLATALIRSMTLDGLAAIKRDAGHRLGEAAQG